MHACRYANATPLFVCIIAASLFQPIGFAQDNETDPVILSAGADVMEWRAPNGDIMFTTPAPVDGGVVIVDESSSVAWVVSQNDIVNVSTNPPFQSEVFVTVDTSPFFGDELVLTDGFLSPNDASLVEGGAALCLDLNDGPPNVVNHSATVRIDLNTGTVDVGAVWSYHDETIEETPPPCSIAHTERPSPYTTPAIEYDEETCSVFLETTGRSIDLPREYSDCVFTELGHSHRRGFTAVGVFVALGDFGWEDLYFLDHSVGRLVTLPPFEITTEESVQWHWMNDMAIVGEHVVLLAPGPSARMIPYGAAWLY